MTYKKIVDDIFTELQKSIFSKSFKRKYFSENCTVFSRTRCMPLQELIAFLFQRSTYSMDIKLDQWFQKWFPEKNVVSRQAISKARQKLPVEIFHDALRLSAQIFLKSEKKKDWNGYQIYAIDGTDLQIPTTSETLRDFGASSNGCGVCHSQASASALYDVMNDIILDSVICPYKTAERTMAEMLLDSVMTNEYKKNSIVLFDRGYPSYQFLGYLFDHEIYFVMRVKKQMSRLRSLSKKDGEVYRKCGKKCRTIRTIQLMLEGENEEYLITNIPKEKMGIEKFRELYFLRWGIEGKYGEWKTRLEVENFSGTKSVCIKQDYYISLFISNISSIVKQEADKRYHGKTESGKEYQSRRSYLIYQINYHISGILLQKVESEQIVEKIIEMSKKKRSQIRRNRKCERNQNLNRRKYNIHHKLCI